MKINIQELRNGNYLDLSGCKIGDEEAEALAEALPSSGLINLDLSENNIGATGTKALANALRDPSCALITLNLEGNPITKKFISENYTYDGLNQLFLALRYNLRLEEIMFNGKDDTKETDYFKQLVAKINLELDKNRQIQNLFELYLGNRNIFDQDQQDEQDQQGQQRKPKTGQSQKNKSSSMKRTNYDYFLLNQTDQQNQQQQDQQQKSEPLQRQRSRSSNIQLSPGYSDYLHSLLNNQDQQDKQSQLQAQKKKIYSPDFLRFLDKFRAEWKLQEKVKRCIAHRNKTELPTVENPIGKIQTKLHTTQQQLRTVPVMKTRPGNYFRMNHPELLQPLLGDGSE